MEYSDNAAGRLRDALFPIGEALQQSPGQVAAVAWCDVLGYTYPNEMPLAIADLAELRVIAHQVPSMINIIERGHVTPDIALKHYDKVIQTADRFTLVEIENLRTSLQYMSEGAWYALDLVHDTLHRVRPEPVIEMRDRAELLEQVENLIHDVAMASDLDEDTRSTVLGHLRGVETALRRVRIRGTQPVVEATERMFGAPPLAPDLWDRVATSKLGPRIAKLAGALLMTLGAVGGLPAITGGHDPPQLLQITNVQITEVDYDASSPVSEDVIDGEVVEDESTSDPGPP